MADEGKRQPIAGMWAVLRNWYRRHFSDPQVVILALVLIFASATVLLFGHILAPLLASLVIAYILDGAVERMRRSRIPRLVGVVIVFTAFVAGVLLILFILLPALVGQIVQLGKELPNMLDKGQKLLLELPQRYPGVVSDEGVARVLQNVQAGVGDLGRRALSVSLSSLVGAITVMVYLVVVPLLVFFMLKDKQLILDWFAGFMPKERGLVDKVWRDLNSKIASYVRGKSLEVLVVWVASYIAFAAFGLNYAALLSLSVGLSVIIPYVGAVAVTVPIVVIAYTQWGLSASFTWVLVTYGIIQFIDGNLLVPLLFSEVVKLHPVAIISAVLIFGGLWGMWGVFFAIPLGTLVHAVLNVWPRVSAANETPG